MSCYIVEDSLINKLVSYFSGVREHSDAAWYVEPLVSADYLKHRLGAAIDPKSGLPSRNLEAERLGRAMHLLNVRSWNVRYGEEEQNSYVWKLELPPCRQKVVEFIETWLYQCHEGDVMHDPLYKAVDEVANRIARSLVREMPDLFTQANRAAAGNAMQGSQP